MGHPKKVTDKRLAAALKRHGGIMSLAAKQLKMTRQSVFDRVQKTPMLKEAIAHADDELLDLSESQLVKSLRRGDKDMVRFHLTQRGKKRGYGNRVDVSVDDQQIEAILSGVIAGAGGDAAAAIRAYRDNLAQLGIPALQIP